MDRLSLILAPILIGGDGRRLLDALGVRRLDQARVLQRLEVRRLGGDVLLSGEW